MRLNALAIDTSGASLGVALVCGEVAAATFTLNAGYYHAEKLMPAVAELTAAAGIEARELDLVAVTSGPGSFTGLRVGTTSARALAWALAIPLVPVPTLDALAYGARLHRGTVCAVLDARRDAVFAAIYQWDHSPSAPELAGRAVTSPDRFAVVELARRLRKCPMPLVIIGEAALKYRQLFLQEGIAPQQLAGPSHGSVRPDLVAIMGTQLLAAGVSADPMLMLPDYYRDAGAERGHR